MVPPRGASIPRTGIIGKPLQKLRGVCESAKNPPFKSVSKKVRQPTQLFLSFADNYRRADESEHNLIAKHPWRKVGRCGWSARMGEAAGVRKKTRGRGFAPWHFRVTQRIGN